MEDMQMLLEPLKASLQQIGEFLPRALLGLAILIIGWLVAKAARFAIIRMLRAINFGVLTDKAGVDQFLKQGGGNADTVTLLGLLVYWLVILAALMVAVNSMGLAYVTGLVGQIVLFVPRVIVAVLIVAFGAYFSRFVGMAVTAYCKGIGLGDAELLGRVAFHGILAFVILIAIDQLGLGQIIQQTFLILIAATGLALALAFGIGGAKRAGSLLDNLTRRTPDPAEPRDDKPLVP